MIRCKSYHCWYVLCLLFVHAVMYAEDGNGYYDPPLRIPLMLSGNFGELRSNHFHSGLDFKTQQVTGKPVYTVAEGYVSRIVVSPWGYGNALYINHPNGTTSVYAHLARYAPRIDSLKRAMQSKLESFSIDCSFKADDCPLQRGELVAYSGNTGSSGGPHLHFELRDTKTERVFDALPYFKNQIKDTRAPRCRGVIVYPITGEGSVENNNRSRTLSVSYSEQGKMRVEQTVFSVWGKIGLGVKANDYMDDTYNVYGVHSITLKVDGEVVSRIEIDRYAFDETRYLNSLTDYKRWRKDRSWYIRSFREPGNRLPVYKQLDNDGYLQVDEERLYEIEYELEDLYGNRQSIPFKLQGVKQEILVPSEDGYFFPCLDDNKIETENICFECPEGMLYTDSYIHYSERADSLFYSSVHSFDNPYTPLHSACPLAIRIERIGVADPSKYYIANVSNGGCASVGGKVEQGWVKTSIKAFGDFAVMVDTLPPVITPKVLNKGVELKKFQFAIGDSQSGIASYRGTIDGKWVLFECSPGYVITYTFKRADMEVGKEHLLQLEVLDGCGNKACLEHKFRW